MKRFRCGDLIPGCQSSFTGTRDDILAQASDHARRDHGIDEFPPELVSQFDAHLHDA